MLFRAIAGLPPGPVFPKDYTGPHLKTHSFDPTEFTGKADAAVFLFGDVVSAVLSTRARRWGERHFQNCGAVFDPQADIFGSDVLNYERMFDAWMRPGPIPHACVRYETLHERAPELSEHLGLAFTLPPKKRRRWRPSRADDATKDRIRAAYRSLIRKVKQAPDFQWFD